MNKTSIFQRPVWVVVFALTAAIAWGWAYPLIKLGMNEFGIQADMTMPSSTSDSPTMPVLARRYSIR